MSKSYIPEETYVVCTFQMSPKPQKLIASRANVSVFHEGKKPMLTEEDKNLDVQFICKSPIILATSFLAFGAGLLIGALLLSSPIGWIFVGCLSVVIGAAYIIKSANHTCTAPMKAGNWISYHPDVKFNGHNAITQISMLNCDNGGILKPFFSQTLALNASKSICNTNYLEVGTNTTISFFAGLLLPETIKGITTVKTGLYFAITNIAGLGITWTVQYLQKRIIRSDEEYDNNEIYKKMNTDVDENTFFQIIDDPSDLNDLPIDYFKNTVKKGKIVSQNHAINQMINRFSNMTTAHLKENTEYRQFLKDVNKGVYGQALKQSMANLFGKIKPNKTSVVKGSNHTYKQFKSSFKSMAKSGGKGTLFFLPFLSTYFSENTKKALAKEAQKDMINGINIIAQTPLGI